MVLILEAVACLELFHAIMLHCTLNSMREWFLLVPVSFYALDTMYFTLPFFRWLVG